jgi:hypothetical protein
MLRSRAFLKVRKTDEPLLSISRFSARTKRQRKEKKGHRDHRGEEGGGKKESKAYSKLNASPELSYKLEKLKSSSSYHFEVSHM